MRSGARLASAQLVRTGQLGAVATTGPERASWLPDVPTMAELGLSGFDGRLWVGLFASAKVQAERISIVEPAIARAMTSEAIKGTP